MFWKILKWGGSAAVVLVVVFAFLNAPTGSEQTQPAQTDMPATNKKFNF